MARQSVETIGLAMRHHGCGGQQGKAELTGIERASSRPMRRIVWRGSN
jgi:hypothetical protein